MPTLSGVTLNGAAQTTNPQMTNLGVAAASGWGSGWNVTVAGLAGSGNSAVFKQYCPTTTCGSDSQGYVSGGQTLPANSLTLSSTGAGFFAQNGSTGTAPTLQCSSACNVDSASATKVASAAASAGMGTWLTSGLRSKQPRARDAVDAQGRLKRRGLPSKPHVDRRQGTVAQAAACVTSTGPPRSSRAGR